MSRRITDERIAELRDIIRRAYGGPSPVPGPVAESMQWTWEPHGTGWALYVGRGDCAHGLNVLTVTNADAWDSHGPAVRERIAASVNALPALLDEVERHRADIASTEARRPDRLVGPAALPDMRAEYRPGGEGRGGEIRNYTIVAADTGVEVAAGWGEAGSVAEGWLIGLAAAPAEVRRLTDEVAEARGRGADAHAANVIGFLQGGGREKPRDAHGSIEACARMVNDLLYDWTAARLARPDLALAVHVKHCPQCGGPNDGCDLGQRLEQKAHEGGWR
jgi:hypothetical protein